MSIVGKRKDMCRASWRRDSIVDVNGIRRESVTDVCDDRKRRIPWTFAIRGLIKYQRQFMPCNE